MADLAQLEASLVEHQFLGGDLPSAQDKQVFAQLGSAPDRHAHPNLWAWYTLVALFSDDVKSTWPEPKKPEAVAAADEDEVDWFAENPVTDTSADDAFAAAKAGHAVPVGRSIVTLDVKPASSTVDLDAVNRRIRDEIQMEGLKWSEESQKIPVAFTIMMLRISAVILDSVSTDEIIERIEAFTGLIEPDSDSEEEYEDEEEASEEAAAPVEAAPVEEAAPVAKALVEGKIIQSVDIASFQKL
jgi:translation elongation factor EF-1beta